MYTAKETRNQKPEIRNYLRVEIIVGSDRLQQWLPRAGLVVSAVLLIRFAIDFSEGMKWWLAAPFCLLVIVALVVGIANVFGEPTSESETPHRGAKPALLLAAIPFAFLAS